MKKLKQYVCENKWGLFSIITSIGVAFVFNDVLNKTPVYFKAIMLCMEVFYVYGLSRLDQLNIKVKRLKDGIKAQSGYIQLLNSRY